VRTESPEVPARTRAIAVAAVASSWAIGYFFLGSRAMGVSAVDTQLPIDTYIPYYGWAVWPYAFGIVAITLPAWTIGRADLFRRTVWAYAIVLSVSFLAFYFLPTAAADMRVGAEPRDADGATAWLVTGLRWIDQPANLAPSLHASLATTSALALAAVWAKRGGRVMVLAGWAILAMSLCVLKQHYVFDVVSGTVLGLAAFKMAWRSDT